MNPEDIVSYLKEHPEFFEQHADFLAEVFVPHPHDGRAVSLTERQLLGLRDKNQALESRLLDLIRFGEENDAISEKLHRFSMGLFAPRTLESLVASIEDNLASIFDIPHVTLRIWTGQPDQPGLPAFSEVAIEVCSMVEKFTAPHCGAFPDASIAAWFGEAGERLKSCALVPLKAEESFGLLALTSEDAERFFPEMGTLYLQRLGDMVSAALLSRLADGE